MSDKPLLPLVLTSPLMSRDAFAAMHNLRPEVIRGLIQTNQIPSKKVGRYRFVNMAALTAECLKDAGVNTSYTEE